MLTGAAAPGEPLGGRCVGRQLRVRKGHSFQNSPQGHAQDVSAKGLDDVGRPKQGLEGWPDRRGTEEASTSSTSLGCGWSLKSQNSAQGNLITVWGLRAGGTLRRPGLHLRP